MRIEFFPAAEQELLEAADQYDRHVRGLGSEFVVEVQRITAVLLELSSLGEKLDRIHRRVPLRRFPFSLTLSR